MHEAMLASGKYETSNPAETKKREGIGKNACIGPMTQKRGASAPLYQYFLPSTIVFEAGSAVGRASAS